MKALFRWLGLLGCVAVTFAQAPALSYATASPDPVPDVSASLTTSNASPQLGEPFQITLTVRTPPNLAIVEWPSFASLDYPLEILSEEPRLLSQRASEYVYTQTVNAVLWATGQYLTRELRIIYERDGRRFFAPVQSVSLFVAPQVVDPLSAVPRASLPLVDLPLPAALWLPLLGFVGVPIAWMVIRRKRRTTEPTAPSSRAAQVIIAQLEDVQNSGLTSQEVILLCVEHLRRYLTASLRIKALEMTSSEVTSHLREHRLLPKRLIDTLSTLLEQADLIKFANLAPEVSGQQFVRVTIRWIKQADQAVSGLYD